MSDWERLRDAPLWYVEAVYEMNRLDRWLWSIGWIEPQDVDSWCWTAEGAEHVVVPAFLAALAATLFWLWLSMLMGA